MPRHPKQSSYRLLALGVFCSLMFASIPSIGMKEQDHANDREFWKAIIKTGYKVPPGKSAADLSHSLSQMLGSPDPELRDEIAYSVLADWIYQSRALSPDELRPLISEWAANLKKDIGSTGTDAVCLRSFSALTLSVVIARDNISPFLSEKEFRAVLDGALAYAEAEKDLRGYDPDKGWLHSAAHTADLLKFLARSRYITAADQSAILNAVSHKLRSAGVVFSFGEDERLARTVLSVIDRKDFEVSRFREWLTSIRPVPPVRPELSNLRANQNTKNMLSKLEVIVINGAPEIVRNKEAVAALQETLKGTF